VTYPIPAARRRTERACRATRRPTTCTGGTRSLRP
jgi:hypothetical protein